MSWSHEPGLTFGEFRAATTSLGIDVSEAVALYNHQPVALSSIAGFLAHSPESGQLAIELTSHLSTTDAIKAAAALTSCVSSDLS